MRTAGHVRIASGFASVVFGMLLLFTGQAIVAQQKPPTAPPPRPPTGQPQLPPTAPPQAPSGAQPQQPTAVAPDRSLPGFNPGTPGQTPYPGPQIPVPQGPSVSLGFNTPSDTRQQLNIMDLPCTACHDRAPTLVGANDKPGSGFDGAELSPRSWAAWWEVNHFERLLAARSKRPDPIQLTEPPTPVVDALLTAANSTSTDVRGEALLALGKMKIDRALPVLKKHTTDADQSVALHAWAAIGLLDSQDASSFLVAAPAPSAPERIGWTVAVGLLSKPSESALRTLQIQTEESTASPEAKRLAIWALRVHRVPGLHELFRRIAARTTDPAIASEAIMGMAVDSEPADMDVLAKLLAAMRSGVELPPSVNRKQIGPFELTSADLVRDASIRALADFAAPNDAVRNAIAEPILGPSAVTPRNAAPGAVAGAPPRSGGYGGGDVATFSPGDVISLGEIGTMNDYFMLADRMEVNTLPHRNSPPAPERERRPGRGLAAISVGLLLEHLGGVEQTIDPVQINDFAARIRRTRNQPNVQIVDPEETRIVLRNSPDEALMELLDKADQPSEFRSAVVLAMGIGGQKQRAEGLKRVIESLGPNHGAVFGYGILALGLWSDPDALTLATRQLGAGSGKLDVKTIRAQAARSGSRMSLSEVLGRRAVAQGLAILADAGAIPMLAAQWGREPAVDIELARAIAWCNQTSEGAAANSTRDFSLALAELLQDKPPALAASAAASLGALLDQGTETRLNQLLVGQSFLTRGWPVDAKGKMNLNALQRNVLALANSHYYLYGFNNSARR